MPKIYSSRQVGKLLGADPSSVNRWIDSGKLKAYRTPGGHRRVLHDDLLAFLMDCGIPVPDEIKPSLQTMLLLDPDTAFVRTFKRAIKRADKTIQVQVCSTCPEGLILLGAWKPDVMIFDLDVGGDCSKQICKCIKSTKQSQDTMLIAQTSSSTNGLEAEVLKTGVAALMVKPYKPTAVLDLIRAR